MTHMHICGNANGVAVGSESVSSCFNLRALGLVIHRPLTLANATSGFSVIYHITNNNIANRTNTVHRNVTHTLLRFSNRLHPRLGGTNFLAHSPHVGREGGCNLGNTHHTPRFSGEWLLIVRGSCVPLCCKRCKTFLFISLIRVPGGSPARLFGR